MRISDWSSDVCSSDLFADSAGGGSPTSPLVIVDAASGAILKQFDALKNVEIGTGPGGNENTGQYEYGTEYGFLDVEENGADCTMNSEKVTTINLDHGTSRSEEHTSEHQSLMRISYAVLSLDKKNKHHQTIT